MQIRRPSELGVFISSVRRAKGLSQHELAKLLGVSRVWLGQVERGKASPRLDLVLRVLNELQVTLAVSTGDEVGQPASEPIEPADAIDIDAIADTGLTPSPPVATRTRQRRRR